RPTRNFKRLLRSAGHRGHFFLYASPVQKRRKLKKLYCIDQIPNNSHGGLMKNFIFISPNFPENYWHFCRHLRDNGFNVLGIGDCEYFNLLPELKASLTEYYKVSDLSNYDE